MKKNESNQKKNSTSAGNITNRIKGIVLFVVVFIVINFILISIQTVEGYSFKTKSGEKVTFGYERGFGGIFSKWSLTIDDQLGIRLYYGSNKKIEGYFTDKATIRGMQSTLESDETVETIVTGQRGKKREYSVYKEENHYYCLGYFEKTDSVGYVLWTVEEMNQEEALDIFSKFRATKGLGYWINDIIDLIA